MICIYEYMCFFFSICWFLKTGVECCLHMQIFGHYILVAFTNNNSSRCNAFRCADLSPVVLALLIDSQSPQSLVDWHFNISIKPIHSLVVGLLSEALDPLFPAHTQTRGRHINMLSTYIPIPLNITRANIVSHRTTDFAQLTWALSPVAHTY